MDTVLIAVVGPTASGKSDLALEVGTRLPSGWGAPEIISADAMQLYRGMDIGTAKTPAAQRRGIPHHQIDVLDVTDEASVATYQASARADAEAIWERSHTAIVAGGSGLYVRALTDQITFPGSDPQVRARLEAEAEQGGAHVLYQRLAHLDPASAGRIHPHNVRRVIRALEVMEVTGKPFSATMPRRVFHWPTLTIGLRRHQEDLDRRIRMRAASMFDAGLLEEVRALIPAGLRQGTTASRAIGYAQALAVLDGHLSEAEAVDQIAVATHQLARAQMIWFRPDPRIHWLDVEPDEPVSHVTDRALDLIAQWT